MINCDDGNVGEIFDPMAMPVEESAAVMLGVAVDHVR